MTKTTLPEIIAKLRECQRVTLDVLTAMDRDYERQEFKYPELAYRLERKAHIFHLRNLDDIIKGIKLNDSE